MVSAFTRYSKHTKTASELLGISNNKSLSFLISDINKLEKIIDKTKPHFCIDATNSSLQYVYPHFMRLIKKKINILTLVYPNTRFNWKQLQLYKTLNYISKQNNVVILAGGYTDSILSI